MYNRGGTRRPRRTPATVENGRIVSVSASRRLRGVRFSWRRCLVVLLATGCAVVTNPANEVYWTRLKRELHRLQQRGNGDNENDSMYKEPLVDKISRGRVTNFGLFAVQERLSRVQFLVLGQRIDCGYEREVCQMLREALCHEGPLLWERGNRPYAVHRALSWLFVAAALFALCCEHPGAILVLLNRSATPWTDAALSTFLPFDCDQVGATTTLGAFAFSILDNTLWNLVQLNLFVYPTWQRMDRIVAWQHENSLFRISAESVGANYAFSAAFLLAAAVVGNVCTARTTGGYGSMGCDAIVAVAVGYYRGSRGGHDTSGGMDRAFALLPGGRWSVSIGSLTWTLVAIFAARQRYQRRGQRKLPAMTAAAAWFAANMVGAMVGQYQYENQAIQTAVRTMWNTLEDALEGLFGYR